MVSRKLRAAGWYQRRKSETVFLRQSPRPEAFLWLGLTVAPRDTSIEIVVNVGVYDPMVAKLAGFLARTGTSSETPTVTRTAASFDPEHPVVHRVDDDTTAATVERIIQILGSQAVPWCEERASLQGLCEELASDAPAVSAKEVAWLSHPVVCLLLGDDVAPALARVDEGISRYRATHGESTYSAFYEAFVAAVRATAPRFAIPEEVKKAVATEQRTIRRLFSVAA